MYNTEDISKFVKNLNIIFAHKKYINGKVDYELLEEHLKRTLKYFSIIDKDNNIRKIVKNIISHLLQDYRIEVTKENIDFAFDMFVNAIYLHDLGKINPGFQRRAMDNKEFSKFNIDSENSKHSLLSAVLYIDIYIKKIIKTDKRKKMFCFVFLFSYIISRHHTNLEDVDVMGFCKKIVNKIQKEKDLFINYNDTIDNIKLIEKMYNKFQNKKSIYTYILGKLLFSLIVTCDFSATYEYMQGKEAEVVCDINEQKLIDGYNNRDFIEGIRNRVCKEGINKIRTDIFLESEHNLNENLDKNIFYLEAPTGSGKTNTSINLALNMLKNTDANKMFYIFPFNTLAEQTSQVMDFWEKGKDYMVLNSSTPILNGKDDENTEYERIYFNYQLANFPVVITSHVRFFETLFGTGRENGIWLYKLCNSVVILDEIQSYKNSLWANFINILYTYSKMLNIKIIIMSATLPKLTNLVEKEVDICNLIEGEKYFQNELFKNRVKLDFSMLQDKKRKEERKINIEDVADKVVEVYSSDKSKKILIEFIFKKTARKFFEMLKERVELKDAVIVELSGDDNKFERQKIINKIKDREINIVVSTQVIEAGVDIDMDIGFKDISVLDSEEQFIGRINRSCKRTGYAYFFDYDDENMIYKNDARTEYKMYDKKWRYVLVNKKFEEYFNEILEKLENSANCYNFNSNLQSFIENAGKLECKEIEGKMKLIDNKNYQIVLNYEYSCNGKMYKGSEVWSQYKELLENKENMDYGKLKIKLSIVKELLDMFTFNISGDGKEVEVKNYTEKMGNMFYFENGKEYISSDGKFEREKFEQSMGGMFI